MIQYSKKCCAGHDGAAESCSMKILFLSIAYLRSTQHFCAAGAQMCNKTALFCASAR